MRHLKWYRHNIETVERLDKAGADTGKILAKHGSDADIERRWHANQKWYHARSWRSKRRSDTNNERSAVIMDVM